MATHLFANICPLLASNKPPFTRKFNRPLLGEQTQHNTGGHPLIFRGQNLYRYIFCPWGKLTDKYQYCAVSSPWRGLLNLQVNGGLLLANN